MGDKYANETADEFSARIFDYVSGGFTSISIALGIKSGLFDVLVDHHEKPMTSQELADAAGLKERYVREWLGAMTTAFIVEFHPDTETYRLPPQRVDSFRAGTMTGQGAACSVGVPILSEVFNRMLEVIKKDGPNGLTFSMAPNYMEYNDSFAIPWFSECFIQEFIPSQPDILSKLESGIRMLEIGCGCGIAVKLLAQRFPKSHITGLDIDQKSVDALKEESVQLALTNLDFVCYDATAMPDDWTQTLDYVFIFNVLHDTPRPDLIIDEVKRVMKKGGILSIIEVDAEGKLAEDIGNPAAPFIYTDSLFYCLPMSANFPGSMALGAMWGKSKIKRLLEEKDFIVKSVDLIEGIPEVHFIAEVM